jgi:hypothetical protein
MLKKIIIRSQNIWLKASIRGSTIQLNHISKLFIKANENIDNEAIPDDASRKKTLTPEVVDAKAKSTAETKSKSRAVDAADAEWLIRERHILRGSHFD